MTKRRSSDPGARRVIAVHWKSSQETPLEIYSSLKTFCDGHPRFQYSTLNNYLSKRKTAFENDDVRIERMKILSGRSGVAKPDLPKRLFWEYKFNEMDWLGDIAVVVERVLEKGSVEEWNEIVRFYGLKKVKYTVKNKIGFLSDHKMDEACAFLGLKKEQTKCYIRKQSKPQHWI